MTTMQRRGSGLYAPARFKDRITIDNLDDLFAHHKALWSDNEMFAIIASDIVLRYSVSAAAGDTTAGTAATSLGDQVSTTAVGTALNDMFDNISGAENAASTVDYRGIFLLNNHATLTASSISLFLSSEVAGGASVALGVDPAAASAKGSGSTQMATIANELTAPAGVTFSSPTTDGAGIAVGSLTAGQVRGFWVRRTAANSAALNADGFTLGVNFDTPA